MLLHTTCCYFDDTVRMHASLEAAIAQTGVPVTHLLTGGGLCTYIHELPEPREAACGRTWQRSDKHLNAGAATLLYLASYTAGVDDQAVKSWRRSVGACPLDALEHDGWRLWELIKGSVVAHLRLARVPTGFGDFDEAQLVVVWRFLEDAVRYIEAFKALYDELDPRSVLVFSGLFYVERIAAELAHHRGVRVVATEASCFLDRKFYDPAGAVGNRHSFGHAAQRLIETRILSHEQQEALATFLERSYAGQNNWVAQHAPATTPVRDLLAIPPGRKIVTFFGQWASDSVITYDSPLYRSVGDAIRDTIDAVADRSDVHLVIRLHPGLMQWADRVDHVDRQLASVDLPTNVSLVRGRELNTYDIMRVSDIGVTICSQAGLEMLSMHKPVVLLGRAFYGRLGLTSDVPSRDFTATLIDRAIAAGPMHAWQRGRIDTLMYYLIFEHLVPVDRETSAIKPDGIPRVLRHLGCLD